MAFSLDVRTGLRASQESRGFEFLKKHLARGFIETPKPLKLGLRKMETRNLLILGANEEEPIVHRILASHERHPIRRTC